ncbi:MAG: flagellar motor protein MotA [Rhodospirillaceae bacterium]|nr:MAG: flagellar motor protein MotA [Rhodospirillaceae bacterium]
MTNPRRFLVRMALFITVVLLAVVAVYEPLSTAFMANAPLNGLILGVFVLGMSYNVRQVLQLVPELTWIANFRSRSPGAPDGPIGMVTKTKARLLSPLAAMVGDRAEIKLSAMALRSVLDGIAGRLDEQRDISRYTISLLVFLGLLGTFWGLLDTLDSIRSVISNIQVSGGNAGAVFDDLKTGLEKPLRGMGTAFSSSLFGLAGSLILGFLDLQTGQAQNRFYTELEDWLSSQARLTGGTLGTEGEQTIPAYVEALLEQTAEGLGNLQRTMTRGEETNIQTSQALGQLSEKMVTITDFMRTEQVIMKTLAETHMELKPALEAIAGGNIMTGGSSMDDATRGHIRNIDMAVSRMVEEARTGREDTVSQLRSEIKLLARTVAGRGQ